MACWQTHIPNDSPLNIGIESYELFNIPLSSSIIPCNPGWFIFRGSPFLEYSNPQYIEWYNLPTNHQPTGVLNTNSPARRPPAADRRWSKSRCGTELWQRTTVSPQGNQRNGSGICFSRENTGKSSVNMNHLSSLTEFDLNVSETSWDL